MAERNGMSLRHWLQLSLTEGIGPILSRRLIDVAGGIEAACGANAAMLRRVEGIGAAKSAVIAESLKRAADLVEIELAQADRHGVRLICPDDADYPALLKTIGD